MHLFPNIDTSLLSDFIVLLFSYGKKRPLEWAINKEWGFGKISSAVAFRTANDEMDDANEFFLREFEKRKNEAILLISELVKSGWLYDIRIVREILNNCLENLKQLESRIIKGTPEDIIKESYSNLIYSILEKL